VGIRLPCRGATKYSNAFGRGEDEVKEYISSAPAGTRPVGQAKANAWGYTICMGTCGNGATIGLMAHTFGTLPRTTHLARPPGPAT